MGIRIRSSNNDKFFYYPQFDYLFSNDEDDFDYSCYYEAIRKRKYIFFGKESFHLYLVVQYHDIIVNRKGKAYEKVIGKIGIYPSAEETIKKIKHYKNNDELKFSSYDDFKKYKILRGERDNKHGDGNRLETSDV